MQILEGYWTNTLHVPLLPDTIQVNKPTSCMSLHPLTDSLGYVWYSRNCKYNEKDMGWNKKLLIDEAIR